MFNTPAITWTLTAVLLLGGSYHLLQATKPQQLTNRVNNTLHALMNILMAAMLWNLAPSTMLAQIAILAGAALWFIIQAVARPEFKILCAGSPGRLKCLYHSLSMAGAALMITMMTSHTTAGPKHAIPLSNTHHAVPHPTTTTASAILGYLPNLATPLTIIFATAALVFVALLLRNWKPANKAASKTAPKHSPRKQHSLEALGAAIMALMFATMA